MRSADFKQIAKDSLRGRWMVAIIATLIATLLGATVLNTVSLSFNFEFSEEQPPVEDSENVPTALSVMEDVEPEKMLLFFSMILLGLGVVMMIYSLIALTVGSAVSAGLCQFNLDLVDGGIPRVGTLFSRFGQMKSVLFVRLLTTLYVMLGCLLFVIPGIIMNYSYSMAIFVLADNPGMTAREALRESKRIMKGHKWQLFCLNLSFVGWVLMSILTLGIGLIWVLPYANASYAAFYRNAKNEAGYAF